MSGLVCPNGHASESDDYCDTCGAPMPQAGAAPSSQSPPPLPAAAAQPSSSAAAGPAASGAGSKVCDNCSTDNEADALFCENCGYDFTTGALPRAPDPVPVATSVLDLGGPDAATPAPVPDPAAPDPPPVAPAVVLEWVVELWVDADWYALQDSEETCPSPGLPAVVSLTEKSMLVGRRSVSRNIHPQIDCDGDTGVSRRHAQLTTDGQRWWVEDLQSANGTYVGSASGPLPEHPVPPGQRRELAEDDRIYLGAWTRLVVRRATDEEKAAG